jgi:hypothetical protein
MAKSLEDMSIEELEIDMRNAINKGDSLRYKQVCDTLGMVPDVLDLYEKGEAEESYLIALTLEQERGSETAENKEIDAVKPRRKKPYSLAQLAKDKRIVIAIEGERIDLDGNGDMGRKQHIWKNVYGYRRIMTSKGLIPVEECDNPDRLTSAIRDGYMGAKRRLDEYEKNERALNDSIPFETF